MIQDADLVILSPVQKMELADLLYDTAQQELEALTTPLTADQLREIERRCAAIDAGESTVEPWDGAYRQLMQET